MDIPMISLVKVILRCRPCLLILCDGVVPLASQSVRDSSAVEGTAVRALAARVPAESVALDPGFAESDHAPGAVGSAGDRPMSRTQALARDLGISVQRLSDAHRCPAGVSRCALNGVSAVLMLSEPAFRGDTAVVSATVVAHSPIPSDKRPTYYESIRVTLVRSSSGWTLVKTDQLGIS